MIAYRVQNLVKEYEFSFFPTALLPLPQQTVSYILWRSYEENARPVCFSRSICSSCGPQCGPRPNQNAQSRFRRQGAEERIPNQYIVVLNG